MFQQQNWSASRLFEELASNIQSELGETCNMQLRSTVLHITKLKKCNGLQWLYLHLSTNTKEDKIVWSYTAMCDVIICSALSCSTFLDRTLSSLCLGRGRSELNRLTSKLTGFCRIGVERGCKKWKFLERIGIVHFDVAFYLKWMFVIELCIVPIQVMYTEISLKGCHKKWTNMW